MKKYTTTSDISGAIIIGITAIIFMMIIIGSLIACFFVAGSTEIFVPIILAVVFGGLEIFLIWAFFYSYNMYKRGAFALKGHKEAGKVIRCRFIGGKAPYYELQLEYRNDNKEDCILKCAVACKDRLHVLSRTELPIYVNGEYAAIKIDEIRSLDNKTIYDKSITKYCVFCGEMLNGKAKHCNNCKNFI